MRKDRFPFILFLAAALLAAGGCMMTSKPVEIELKSAAFNDGGYIPARYTCKGEDISPPLAWKGAPAGARAFVIIADDPDAPAGTWDHWVIFNIPGGTTALAENVPTDKVLPDGSRQGMNDFRKTGYGGPCPPPGAPHRYVFTIYALDAALDIPAGSSKEDVLNAASTHVLAQGKLTGLFKR